jgi:hypothetical protein
VVVVRATRDHPAFLFAKVGQMGTVVKKHDGVSHWNDPYLVRADGCSGMFIAQRDEFEVAAEAAGGRLSR